MNTASKSLLLDLAHYPLEQVAEMVGCNVRTLIHLGASNKISIYAYAKNWKTRVIEFSTDDKGNVTGVTDVHPMTLDHIQDGLVKIPWNDLKGWDAFWENQTEFTLSGIDYIQYNRDNPDIEEGIFPGSFETPQTVKLSHLRIKREDVSALLGESPDCGIAETKTEGGVSRKTLLRLIIGMAMDSYGYDPNAKKSPLASELESILIQRNMPVTDDTIRKALDEAKAELPSGVLKK